jgi:hypothetical protein
MSPVGAFKSIALEEFLLAPDPIRRRLVPVPGLMMGLTRAQTAAR